MKINYRILLALMVVAFTISSCGSKKRVVTTKKKPTTEVAKPKPAPEKPKEVSVPSKPKATTGRSEDLRENYILDFKDAAIKEMQLYKIPASITLAQGILESGAGRARLAVEANNHFGIKCHTGWTGGKIYHDDDAKGECFRTYNDATYSYRDHSLFLTQRKRYAGLFNLRISDYKAWAKGLKKAGYATDRSYPDKLISIIERYGLDKYDQIAMETMDIEDLEVSESSTQKIKHLVLEGETLYAISRKYGVSVEHLKRLNSLTSNNLEIGQVLQVK
ncbi:MAG: glucosaminidase domain-containing protein [Nonlabens sp.]